jgi:hypothetical protein
MPCRIAQHAERERTRQRRLRATGGRAATLAPTALLAAMLACGEADAAYSGHPAQNFSAYYYQSPGGVRPSKGRSGGSRHAAAAAPATIPYARSCGNGRTWDGTRCVRQK